MDICSYFFLTKPPAVWDIFDTFYDISSTF